MTLPLRHLPTRSVPVLLRSAATAGAGLILAATLAGPSVAATTGAPAGAPEGDDARPARVPTAVSFAVTGRSVETRVDGVGGTAPLGGSVQLLVDGVVRGSAPAVPVTDDGPDARPAATASLPVPAGTASRATFLVRYLGDASYLSSSGRYDRTSPTVTARLAGGSPVSRWGWFRTPVDVGFDCAAGSSAVTLCGGARRVTESGSVRGWADAADGGAGVLDVDVRIDVRAPRVWTARRAGGGSPLACRASDGSTGTGPAAGSGVASCRLTWVRHQQEGRGGATWREWRAVAVDRAGNRTVRRGTWTGR